jgi:hypothetical protein
VGLVSLRPLEWIKERTLPKRETSRMMIELAEGTTAGDVLNTLERVGDLLALRRDGMRLEVEMRIDWDKRTRALDAVSALPEVQEARWHG